VAPYMNVRSLVATLNRLLWNSRGTSRSAERIWSMASNAFWLGLSGLLASMTTSGMPLTYTTTSGLRTTSP
jgi:hypothetical protein